MLPSHASSAMLVWGPSEFKLLVKAIGFVKWLDGLTKVIIDPRSSTITTLFVMVVYVQKFKAQCFQFTNDLTFCPVNALLSKMVSYFIIRKCITNGSSEMTTNLFIRPGKEKLFNFIIAPVG